MTNQWRKCKTFILGVLERKHNLANFVTFLGTGGAEKELLRESVQIQSRREDAKVAESDGAAFLVVSKTFSRLR